MSGGPRPAPSTTSSSSSAIQTHPLLNPFSPFPRPSSYASVLSGTAVSAPAHPPAFRHPSDLHRHHHLYLPPPFHHHHYQSPHHPNVLNDLNDLNADMQANSSAWRSTTTTINNNTTHNNPPNPDHHRSLPPYSRKFASFPHYNYHDNTLFHSPGGFFDALNPLPSPFFTPSYLRNSSYAARLNADHRARIASAETSDDGPVPSNPFSTLSSSSSSSSHVNLPRIAPSHRGMTHEVIEREPPGSSVIDDPVPLPLLPSRWSDMDKYQTLETIHGGLEVRYTGPLNKHDHEAAAVRADNPMPPQCGVYYFEITVLSKPKDGWVYIVFVIWTRLMMLG